MNAYKIAWIRQSKTSGNFQIKIQRAVSETDEFGTVESQETYYIWRKSTTLEAGKSIDVNPSEWKVDTKENVPVKIDGKEVLMTLKTLLRKL